MRSEEYTFVKMEATTRKPKSIYKKYILLGGMKSLSLKLDEEIYKETEMITAELHCARNRYINEALDLYNKYNKRMLLKKKLRRESERTREESRAVLTEFENLQERNEAI